MKRWRAAFLIALLSALPILFAWNRSPALLRDSDTMGILAAIRRAHDPLKWFRGDWPIENHFYRPVASLTFESDNALWGENAAGYGLTNALLCVACVLLLFGLLREITDRPWPSAAGAAVFALWHVDALAPLSNAVAYGAWATLLVGAIRHRKAWRAYVPAFFALAVLSAELLPMRTLRGRMIDWIPGRTASTMTVFALAAMAAYARFERLRRVPVRPTITPETPPATRSAEATRPSGPAWPWAVVAAVATALALGSYEQATMLPPVLLLVALAFRLSAHSPEGKGFRPFWPLHGVFWALLLGYLALRWGLLPHTVSGYQRQQFSSFRTAFWREMEYVFPPLQGLTSLPALVAETPTLLLFSSGPYLSVANVVATAVAYGQARREAALLVVGLLGSAVAFAPMAPFKIFEHYHYWPMALRSALVVALGLVAGRLAITAWSPPARPAPPRRRPAPGSLPRP